MTNVSMIGDFAAKVSEVRRQSPSSKILARMSGDAKSLERAIPSVLNASILTVPILASHIRNVLAWQNVDRKTNSCPLVGEEESRRLRSESWAAQCEAGKSSIRAIKRFDP